MVKYHLADEIAMEAGTQIGWVVSDNGSDYIDSATFITLHTNAFHVGFNFGGGYRLNDVIYFQ